MSIKVTKAVKIGLQLYDNIVANISRHQGIYDTNTYRYFMDDNGEKLYRVRLEYLGRTSVYNNIQIVIKGN